MPPTEGFIGRQARFEGKTGVVSVFAYGTGKQGYFDLFMASCQRFAIEPVVLGWGQPWIGFGRKTTDIRRAIDQLPGDAIVLSVDPFDVIFLTDLAELAERYRPYYGKFVCGALKLGRGLAAVYNAEFNRSGEALPRTEFGYDHLNTGTWMANAGCARLVIDRLVEREKMMDKDMDQERLTSMYIRGDAEVALDWRCDLFHNLLFKDFLTRRPNLTDIEFSEGRVYNRATETWPCVLHASGNARMETIARSLGYPAEVTHPTSSQKNFSRKAIFHIQKITARLFGRS
jgi:hypothetical protein